MMQYCMADRIKLLFMSRNKRIYYIKKLPVEKRYSLARNIFPWSWRYPSAWHKNICYAFSEAWTYLSPRRQINKEWYDLHSHMSCWILPRLRILREKKIGTPIEFYPEDYHLIDWANLKNNPEERERADREQSESVNKWNAILDDIIYAFEYFLLIEIRYMGIQSKENEADKARYERGMRYFAKYYFNLWD